MKIAIGSDHHGGELRAKIVTMLTESGHELSDVGSNGTESVDYPDIASEVAGAVSRGEADRGILICGSGIGMAIAANKLDGVRAAPSYDLHMAEMCRRHNNANVLCLSDSTVSPDDNLKIVETFVETEFDGGRHQRRVEKIAGLEKK